MTTDYTKSDKQAIRNLAFHATNLFEALESSDLDSSWSSAIDLNSDLADLLVVLNRESTTENPEE